MSMLLAFMPFIVFALLERIAPLTLALGAAALVAALFAMRDWRRDSEVKVLDLGAVILFAALALMSPFAKQGLSIPIVRLVVDIGLVMIAAASLAIGRPFTRAYTRGQEPEHPVALSIFRRTHAIITAVWTLAFIVLVIADALMEWAPAVPLWIDIALIVVAFVAAVRFTAIYPAHVRRRAMVQTPSISPTF